MALIKLVHKDGREVTLHDVPQTVAALIVAGFKRPAPVKKSHQLKDGDPVEKKEAI
jgi:hypothetical protein